MSCRLAILLFLLLGATLADARGVSAQALSTPAVDTIDTSGHTGLKIFAGLYGSYLGVAVPVAMKADDVMFYALGLMAGPGIGLMGASSYSRTHSFSSGDAIALSSLTWFGAMQGHLWAAAADLDDGNANAAFGVLGSLGGFVTAISIIGAHDFTKGHAASLGAGHWWGTALGYLGASASEDATNPDKYRGAAIGGAAGLAMGALTGRNNTHNDIRYLHMGGVLGWLYSAGIVVLQEPNRTGESITQIVGIGAGMTAGVLASKYRPWRSRPGLALDHSGRIRAQVFSIAYGGYLATVVPLASGVDWWEEDTKTTYTLAYMHAPLGLLLGTTYFTRNTSVSIVDALTVSGLTWFGALQGALWASTREDSRTRDVATTSAVGSVAGFLAGTVAARRDLSEAQAAMLGAGNWWGSVLGLLFGGAALGEDAEGESLAAAVAIGGLVGVAVGPQFGKHMSRRNVGSMHIGGLAGWLFGAGVLLAGDGIDFRAANAVMGIATIGGLALGAGTGDRIATEQASRYFDPKPFVAQRRGLSGENHTVVGFTLGY